MSKTSTYYRQSPHQVCTRGRGISSNASGPNPSWPLSPVPNTNSCLGGSNTPVNRNESNPSSTCCYSPGALGMGILRGTPLTPVLLTVPFISESLISSTALLLVEELDELPPSPFIILFATGDPFGVPFPIDMAPKAAAMALRGVRSFAFLAAPLGVLA